MKKLLGIILVIIILAGAFYAYQNLKLPKVISLESITPQEVIYYVYSYNPDKKIKDFQANSFSKQIMENAFFREFIRPELDKIQKQIPALSDFLQQDAAIALYSLSKQPFGDILALTRIDSKKNIKLKKTLADYYLSLGGKTEVTHKNYRGIKISGYKLPEQNIVINCAFLSDVLLISNNDDIIKKSIDIYKDGNQKNLVNNKNFQKLAPKIKPDALFWIFADNQYYNQDVMRAYEIDKPADVLLKMKPWTEMMNVFEGYVAYTDYDSSKSGLVTRIYQSFNKSASNQELLNVINYNRPIDKNTLGLTSENAIAYYGGSHNLVNVWKLIRKFAASIDEIMKAQLLADPKYAQHKDQINAMGFDNVIIMAESFLGINIENDILSALDNNFGIIFTGLKDMDIKVPANPEEQIPEDTDGKQNITIMFPQIYGFVELKDSMRIQKTMEALSQRIVDNINKLIPSQQSQSDKQPEGTLPQTAAAQPQETQNQPQDNSKPEDAPKPEEAQNKPEPEAILKLLNLKTEDYNGITLRTIEISNPQASFLTPTYCVLDDKYLIFSLSQNMTKKVADIYINKTNSFNSNAGFTAVKDKMLTDYSNIIFFNLGGLIENIRSTKTFNEFELPNTLQNSQPKLSKENLNSFLDILSNITTFVLTNKTTAPDTIETICYIKIKGL
ncbi:MAG: hypothetical protein V2A64_05365 [Candidatus Omnitrophota bacterium]